MSTKKEKCCDVCKPNGVGYCNNLLCRPCHLQSESIEWEQYCISNDEAYNDIDPKIRGMLSRSDLKHFVNGWNTFVKTKLSKAITTAVAKRDAFLVEEVEKLPRGFNKGMSVCCTSHNLSLLSDVKKIILKH